MSTQLPPNPTPEQWIEWFESQSEQEKLVTAQTVIENSHEAWTCRAEAHKRYLRECRENHQ